LQDSDLQADGSDLSDVLPEHLLLMDADIELPPPEDEDAAYEFVTHCYQEQIGVSVSEMTSLDKDTAPSPQSSVPELSQWLLNGLEFIEAVDAGSEVDDVKDVHQLDRGGVEHAFSGL
jgi:hypothetical protein